MRPRVALAACEQYAPGLPTRAWVGQRSVRTHASLGQRSSPMSQHSCAKGLPTRPWTNTHCELGKGWKIQIPPDLVVKSQLIDMINIFYGHSGVQTATQ